ncbi:MAG: YkgJ family cysteine cluster protein [Proteobacteria bacterium]|nr:YkgJ family cysteine cluster protein [Pseudomonadota bacterium]
MTSPSLPDHVRPVSAEQGLVFACHPGVSCFTHCCRELDLAVSPYDVLRLKQRLRLSSSQFLDRYVIVEWDEQCVFPTCYLTMVDDGRASCVFVGSQGCSVYDDRPGSCRAYPLGRGVARGDDGVPVESLVLLGEPHCRGFAEASSQTVAAYLRSQELEVYNRFNDALLPLVQHAAILAGAFRPTRLQLDQYMLALYDLDNFRQEMANGRVALHAPLTPAQLAGLAGDDGQLLLLGIRWLLQEWFGE